MAEHLNRPARRAGEGRDTPTPRTPAGTSAGAGSFPGCEKPDQEAPVRTNYPTRAKLIRAALSAAQLAHNEDRLPGPNDDADDELADERLLIAAREFVTAHDGQEAVGG